MKLRIQGNSLRLRLTRPEVARLREKGDVSETISFPVGGAITYRILERAGADGVQTEFAQGTISVSLPATAIELWATSDEVGIYGQDGQVRIAIEKDFRCLTRTSDEQEADAYPHPAEPCCA